jgi:hypothetical protein
MVLGAGATLWDPRTRPIALLLTTTIVVRTAVMAYTYYSMPRYALEVIPLGFVLIAGGAAVAWRRLRRSA